MTEVRKSGHFSPKPVALQPLPAPLETTALHLFLASSETGLTINQNLLAPHPDTENRITALAELSEM